MDIRIAVKDRRSYPYRALEGEDLIEFIKKEEKNKTIIKKFYRSLEKIKIIWGLT